MQVGLPMSTHRQKADLHTKDLFRALAHGLGLGAEEHHTSVRKWIVAYLRSHRELYEGMTGDIKFDEYCAKASEPEFLGDMLILQVAADIFATSIIVQIGDDITIELKKFKSRTCIDDSDTLRLYYSSKEWQSMHRPVALSMHPPAALMLPKTLPEVWKDGCVRSEIPYRTIVAGSWHLLEYRDTRLDVYIILNKLRYSKVLPFSLDRFFEYKSGGSFHVFVVFDFTRSSDGRDRRSRNARFRYENQFDVDGERPKMWYFKGYPHPDAREWDVLTLQPMAHWHRIDGRSRKPYRGERKSASKRQRSEVVGSLPAGHVRERNDSLQKFLVDTPHIASVSKEVMPPDRCKDDRDIYDLLVCSSDRLFEYDIISDTSDFLADDMEDIINF